MKKMELKNKYSGVITGLILAIFVALAGVFFSKAVLAEDLKNSLTVSPMSQKIILTPGETYEGTIKVSNSSSSTSPMTYEAKIGPYSPIKGEGKDDYGGSDVSTRSNRNIMADWTKVDKSTGTLEPNESAIVTYRIQVPKDAPAGAQYISILVSNITPEETSGKKASSIESKVQIASIVYANVAGETVEKGSITENNIPTFLTNNKLEATSMVRNEGNVYTDATYTLQVWPLNSNEEICTNEEKTETSMVLPNTERYHVQTCDLPMVGMFEVKQVVKIFGEESVLEKTVLVCPVWLMILVLIIIIAIIAAVTVTIKKHKKGVDTD